MKSWGSLALVGMLLLSACTASQPQLPSSGALPDENVKGFVLPNLPTPATTEAWEQFKAQDQKIHDREVGRLRMAVQALDPQAPHRLAMLHYPPLYCNQLQTAYTEILQEAKIELCVYGHLHLPSFNPSCFDLDSQGIKYRLISADYLQFRPRELLDLA